MPNNVGSRTHKLHSVHIMMASYFCSIGRWNRYIVLAVSSLPFFSFLFSFLLKCIVHLILITTVTTSIVSLHFRSYVYEWEGFCLMFNLFFLPKFWVKRLYVAIWRLHCFRFMTFNCYGEMRKKQQNNTRKKWRRRKTNSVRLDFDPITCIKRAREWDMIWHLYAGRGHNRKALCIFQVKNGDFSTKSKHLCDADIKPTYSFR